MNIYIVLVFQVLISSGTHLVAKAVSTDINAIVLTCLRSAVATGALLVIFFVKEKRIRVLREDYAMLAWLSFLCIPVNQFLFLYGIRFTPAANGALLYATTPSFVLVLSSVMLKERITKRKLIGVAIAFFGVLVVVFERGINLSADYIWGNFILTCAVLAWALYTIQGKKLIVKYGAFHISALSMIGGTIMFLPLGLIGLSGFDFSTLTLLHWQGILYLGLGTSILGYFLWMYAIGKIDTTKVAVFSNAQPIVTTILSVILLHQSFSVPFIIGGIITIAGVALTQMK
ncbi:MAG TPA: EamA family transporter [Bacteroidota bacterium]|nr:EamA family transporter [Bacteroidota bacterium]